ncbi:12244_t:CDS:2 [Acaulospora morrowiae]|uniref:12244_t:CDS:1 n=1 Tax=Acaulospora morrowiae TaxID=94023 RepID=A0A9N9CRM2_9GLOM|nr:12244_t:CDS:2 [Acaulospora morrowiae]
MRQQVINNSVETSEGEDRAFHVGVKRGEVANRILIVNDSARAIALSKLLDKHPKPFVLESKRGGFLTITGRYNKVPISVMSVMVGYTMMDIFLREIRQVVDGDLTIIRLGMCDSIGNPNVGDVIVPHGAFSISRNYDYFIKGVDTVDCLPIVDNPYNISKVAYGSEELSRELKAELSQALYPSPIYTCLNASSDSFYASQGRIDPNFIDDNNELITTIVEKYPDVHIMDMENFILYHLANMCNYNPQPPSVNSKDASPNSSQTGIGNYSKQDGLLGVKNGGHNGSGILLNSHLNSSQSSFHSSQQSQNGTHSPLHSSHLKPPTTDLGSVGSMNSLKSRVPRNDGLTRSNHSSTTVSANSVPLKQKHSLSFLKSSKSGLSSGSGHRNSNSFSGYKSLQPQITVTTTTNSHITYTANPYYSNNRHQNSSSTLNNSHVFSQSNNRNSTSIKATSAMMICYDTKTNSQIPPEMMQNLEKICGEAILNTLAKTQVCYVHEEEGSVWNFDYVESINGKKKRTKSIKKSKEGGVGKGEKLNVNDNRSAMNGKVERHYSKSLDITRSAAYDRSFELCRNDITSKNNSFGVPKFNNSFGANSPYVKSPPFKNSDVFKSDGTETIAGRYSIDIVNGNKYQNYGSKNRFGKIFGGGGGSAVANEAIGRYSIDVGGGYDARGHVIFEASAEDGYKESGGGKLRRVMSRMLKIKKKSSNLRK